MALNRQEKLFGAHEIQRFNRDADETVAWITEKDVVLSSDEFGRDLASVQTLQRKHEGVERDLAALEDKVMTLGQEAARLCGIHPDHADQIKAKHQEIENNWERLTQKAKVRLRCIISFLGSSIMKALFNRNASVASMILICFIVSCLISAIWCPGSMT